MTNERRLIVFDCDGTIVDSQHAIVAAMDAAFARLGLTPPPRQATLSVVGLSLSQAVARLLPPDRGECVEPGARYYKEAFTLLRADPAHHEPLYPRAREVIAYLADSPGHLLGIATGKSRRGVDALFDRESLHPYFSTIQTADDHPSKPHPAMLVEAMAETGAEPSRTVMIGDTTFDIEMAREAQAFAIGVSWGYHAAEELAASGAHAIINDYSELPAAVAALLARD